MSYQPGTESSAPLTKTQFEARIQSSGLNGTRYLLYFISTVTESFKKICQELINQRPDDVFAFAADMFREQGKKQQL